MENIPDTAAIASLTEKMENIEKMQDEVQAEVREAMQILRDLVKPDESKETEYDKFIDAKLSDAAKNAVEVSVGPLESPALIELLMKTFSKPRPAVLPIVRKYTTDIKKVTKQIQQVKDGINKKHREYKEHQRHLDENLNKRITKLIKNIEKELKEEENSGMTQTSILDFGVSTRGTSRAEPEQSQDT